MQEIYPSFYHEFKCIANLCEDSCCKDWDIDIDSDTEEFYKTVQGPLGDKRIILKAYTQQQAQSATWRIQSLP